MNKVLDITEKQILRGHILRICEMAEPYGAGTEVIKAALRKEGYSYRMSNIADCCAYLQEKGLIEITSIQNKVLGIKRDIAKITAKGIDFLEGTITEPGIELL